MDYCLFPIFVIPAPFVIPTPAFAGVNSSGNPVAIVIPAPYCHSRPCFRRGKLVPAKLVPAKAGSGERESILPIPHCLFPIAY